MTHLAPNKRRIYWAQLILVFAAATIFGVLSTSIALAQTSVTDALYSMNLNLTNTTATQKDDINVAFSLSTASLIEDSFINSTALNSIVQRGSVDNPSMPGTNRIVVKGAAQDDGGVFTDYTSQAQSSATGDVQLLPSSPAVSDAFYMGFDIPAGMTTVDIDQSGAGTWAVTWEYYNGSGWSALSDVDDRTNAFSTLGRNIVTWTVPSDWDTTTVVSISAYWVRARVSSFTSSSVQPLATKIQYETGEWWVWAETLPLDTQEQFALYMGGSITKSYHEIFTGAAGLTTDDAAGLEPGNTYSILVSGRSHFDSQGSSSCVACKSGVISVYPSTSDGYTATVTGSGTTTLTVTGMTVPDTGSNNVILASDGSDVALWVDGGAGMATGDAQTITDNANSWTWGSSDTMDYLDQVGYDSDVGDVITIFRSNAEWNTGTMNGTKGYGTLGLANE